MSMLQRLGRSLVRNRHLIWDLFVRDVEVRYRGTHFGLFWSFLSPLVLLAIYTFVFGIIFRAKFDPSSRGGGVWAYGLTLFCGLNLFNLFAEVLTRSPGLILQHPNYVKKVVFPVEIFPVVATMTAIFHCLVAFIPLTIGLAILRQAVPFTVLYVFVFLFPLAILSCGCSWILSSLGVFFRDLQNILALVVTVLMFTSAVFYPLKVIPDPYRAILWYCNPLVRFIEGARSAIIFSYPPALSSYAVLMLFSLVVALFGFFIFDRAKPAFADVM